MAWAGLTTASVDQTAAWKFVLASSRNQQASGLCSLNTEAQMSRQNRFYLLKGAHQMYASEIMAIEKPQSRRFRKSKSTLKPACPGCRMIKNDWPGEGYTHDGETYCCQGCAEGTGCMCVAVGKPGFSRQGQKLTRAEPRPGEQRSGAPAPRGELSGERDNFGTEEALDQGG
ncbi:MAG: hypothetical protein ACREFF_07065 [Candidatus Udaeobacter sp.]